MRYFFISTAKIAAAVVGLAAQFSYGFAQNTQAPITLTGTSLTVEQLVSIARNKTTVRIADKALEQVRRSHELLLIAAAKNLPIYGLNRGVGLNKDKTIFQGDVLTPAARQASEQFNLNDLYATSAAVGPTAPAEIVRAAMAARLNTLLLGNAGVQPAVVERLTAFLNDDIVPILPSGGSVGEADITILAHIGLAMVGQGEVWYHGQIMAADKALAKAHLKPIHFYAKDALSLFSSNAYTAGMSALAVSDVQRLVNNYALLLALSLEGINGNIAPFLGPVQAIRPFPGQNRAAKEILCFLKGSYLLQPSSKRALQDPLSFRTASQLVGTTLDILQDLKRDLRIQLNSSDDNPAVIVDVVPTEDASEQEKTYYVRQGKRFGAVIPTANFEPLTWVLNLERLNIALGHLSASSTQRIVKLGSESINQSARFLAPDQHSIGFAAIQKPIMFLNTDIQQHIMPVSTISYPMAGDIEDTATNALLVFENLQKIVDDLYHIMGFELIHASQAVDLKKRATPNLQLSKSTQELYAGFREEVPFLQKDRPLTPDIKKAYQFISRYHPLCKP